MTIYREGNPILLTEKELLQASREVDICTIIAEIYSWIKQWQKEGILQQSVDDFSGTQIYALAETILEKGYPVIPGYEKDAKEFTLSFIQEKIEEKENLLEVS